MSSWIKRFVASASLACSLVATLPANAAVAIVLKLTGIAGESQVSQHVGEIDVLSWSWGVTRDASQSTTAAATTAARPGTTPGAAKVNAHALVVTKYIDAASPVLFQSAIHGKRVGEATLVLIKTGGRAPIEMVKVKLKDVIVSSVKVGAPTANDRFTEEVSLAFASAEYTYVRQNADQSAGAVVTTSW